MHFAYGRDMNHPGLKGRLAVGLQSGPQCSLTHIFYLCVNWEIFPCGSGGKESA